MQFLTNIVLIVGVLAIVASWVVAVRLIRSDNAASTITAQSTDQDTRRQDVLATIS